MDRLKSLGCQLVGVTRDSILSIGQLPTLFGFPILSDKSLQLAKAFGVRRPSGLLARGTFILDKERRVRHSSVYPRCVARSSEEVVRLVTGMGRVDAEPGC